MQTGFPSISKSLKFEPSVNQGELAQLARALAWHARGRRFDSDILHMIVSGEW